MEARTVNAPRPPRLIMLRSLSSGNRIEQKELARRN